MSFLFQLNSPAPRSPAQLQALIAVNQPFFQKVYLPSDGFIVYHTNIFKSQCKTSINVSKTAGTRALGLRFVTWKLLFEGYLQTSGQTSQAFHAKLVQDFHGCNPLSAENLHSTQILISAMNIDKTCCELGLFGISATVTIISHMGRFGASQKMHYHLVAQFDANSAQDIDRLLLWD